MFFFCLDPNSSNTGYNNDNKYTNNNNCDVVNDNNNRISFNKSHNISKFSCWWYCWPYTWMSHPVFFLQFPCSLHRSYLSDSHISSSYRNSTTISQSTRFFPSRFNIIIEHSCYAVQIDRKKSSTTRKQTTTHSQSIKCW
jgi:hypothetical protein